MLLDDPLTACDAHTRQTLLRDAIGDLARRGATILLTTADPETILQADEIRPLIVQHLVMQPGGVLQASSDMVGKYAHSMHDQDRPAEALDAVRDCNSGRHSKEYSGDEQTSLKQNGSQLSDPVAGLPTAPVSLEHDDADISKEMDDIMD